MAALAASVSLLPLTAAPALALQDQEASEGGREVITVTARRREESIQDVPVAVTAYSGEQLENTGAVDITAIAQTTPNVTLENTRATNTTLTAFIRGVGQQDPLVGFEQGVGIYLDDVYLNRPQGAVMDLYDVERIEVLRGPQGTLYGRNTIGGAVKYVTRRIDPDNPTASLRASVGSLNQLDLVATGSAPLTDTFRVSAAAGRFTRDGFGENLTTGEDNYNKDIFALRGSMEWEPSDNFFVRLSGDYIDDQSNTRNGYRTRGSLFSPSDATPLSGRYDTNGGVANFAPFPRSDFSGEGFQLYAEWQVNDRLTLKSITAQREDEFNSLIDFDSTPLPNFDAWVNYQNEQFSQEFQALFEGDGWNAVAGLYYLDADSSNAFDVFIFGGATSFTFGDSNTEAIALFAEATFDVTDRLHLTLGGRYTEDERNTTVTREVFAGQGSPFFGNTGAFSLTPPVIVDGEEVVPTFTGSRTDDAFTPRIILAYDATENVNVYGSYSQGFKGGLFDPRGNFSTPEIREGVAPEFVDSYEVGVKGVFADGRILANFAAFYAEYTDVQIPGSVIVSGPGGTTSFQGTLTNAGAAEFRGAELEATVFVTDELTALLGLGVIDGEYTEFIQNGVNIASTATIQNTPDVTSSVMLDYTKELPLFGHAGELSVIGAWSYRSEVSQFEFSSEELDQDEFSLYNASIVWNSSDGQWSAGVHGRNLTDEAYITSGYYFPTIDNSTTAFYGDPRTVTGTIAYRY
jgi:iron complex outermembrane receptor protein